MFHEIEINFSAFFDGDILPLKNNLDCETLFFIISFKQNGKTLIRHIFDTKTPTTKFYIFSPKTKMTAFYLEKSTDQVVGRMRNEIDPIHVNIYIVTREDNIIGITRRISEGSERQDEPVLKIDQDFNNNAKMKVQTFNSPQVFEETTELKIYDGKYSSPIWYTQRNFYSTCHYDATIEAQEKNLTKVVNYLIGASKKKTFENVLELLLHFGMAITKRIHYKGDTEIGNPRKSNDRGDSKVEFTHRGDCEDFAHYYMRMIRLLMECHDKVNISTESQVFKLVKYMKLNYVPLVYICRVKIHGSLQYHATMLLVRKSEGVQNISFEVTDPKDKEYSMYIYGGDSTFYKWHVESYFLVDANFITRIEHSSLGQMTFNGVVSKSFNF